MDNDILDSLQAVLTTTPTRWQSLAATLPPALLRRPAAPGEWSALECLQHLIDAERGVFPVRARAFLAGQDLPAYDPDRQGTRLAAEVMPEALAGEFAALRAESLGVLEHVTPADLKRQVRHEELGPVTLSQLLHEWAGHDLMHTVQAERALMQPFIEGCGPWRMYFLDHVASED